MFRRLFLRTLRDSAWMLASCCALLLAFIWLRIWIAAQINFEGIIGMFASGDLPAFALKLLPVSIEDLAGPLGRTAFGFEEMPVVLLAAWWAVARGSECVAGRVDDGSMELLLAQPISRLTTFTAHAAGSLLGVVALGLAAWGSTALGVATADFARRPQALEYLPAAVNLTAMTAFLLGAATLAGALAPSRGRAVGWMIAFYFVEVALKIVALLSPSYAWLKRWTFATAYEPTQLAVGLQSNPEKYAPLFWQYNGVLVGLGAAALTLAAAIFCHRDVPAPS